MKAPTLSELTAAVVLPSIDAVLRDTELQSIQLSWISPADGPSRHREDASLGAPRMPRREARLTLLVCGEGFDDVIYDDVSATQLRLEDPRERLTSNLVDFVAESRFGWGQNRTPPPAVDR